MPCAPLLPTRLMRMVFKSGLRKQINQHIHFLSGLILDLKYGVGSCAYWWCRALPLSTIEPEKKTELHFVTRVLYNTACALNFAKSTTDTVRVGKGESISSKSCLRQAEERSRTTFCKLVLTVLQASCGGSGSDLRGPKEWGGGGRTVCCPWGEIYWFPPSPSPPLSVKALAPLLSRRTILMERSAKWKEMWVGGTAGCDVESKKKKERGKKKRFYCVSLTVLSESKWASDGKKENAERQYGRENKI